MLNATLSLLDRSPPLHPLYTLTVPKTQDGLKQAFQTLREQDPARINALAIKLDFSAEFVTPSLAAIQFQSFALYLSLSGEGGTQPTQSALSYPEPGVFVATVRVSLPLLTEILVHPDALTDGLLKNIFRLEGSPSWSARIGYNFDLIVT